MILKAGLLLFLFVSAAAAAQEAPGAAEPEAVQTRQQATEQQAEEKAADVAPEFFDPTEEISEDYSIEFPVDI